LMNIIVRSAISLNRQIGIVITRLNSEDIFSYSASEMNFQKMLIQNFDSTREKF
jgi:hypothetical protein